MTARRVLAGWGVRTFRGRNGARRSGGASEAGGGGSGGGGVQSLARGAANEGGRGAGGGGGCDCTETQTGH